MASFISGSSTSGYTNPWNARYKLEGQDDYTYFDKDNFDINTMMNNPEFEKSFLTNFNAWDYNTTKNVWNKYTDQQKDIFGQNWLNNQHTGYLQQQGGLVPEFGNFGTGAELAGLGDYDESQWNAFVNELVSTDPTTYAGLSTAKINNGEFIDPRGIQYVSPEVMEKFGTYLTEAEQATQAQEADQSALLTQEEADSIWNMDLPNQTATLTSYYDADGDGEMSSIEYAKASEDWTSFLASTIPGTNQTYLQFYSASGTVPQIGPDGYVVSGDMDENIMQQLAGSFADWKAESNAKTAFATEQGVDIGDVVTNDNGEYVLDPDKYTYDEDTGEYTSVDVVTDEESEDALTFLEDYFGGDRASQFDTAIAEGIMTQDEIDEAFTKHWAPYENEYNTYTKPEATAQGTEAGGGLGSGVGNANLRATNAYTSQKLAAEADYTSAMKEQNLKYLDTALQYAKTPAEISEAYSRAGVNLANTSYIQTQAANVIWDQDIEDSQNWANLGLTDANIKYLESMTDKIDTESLFNLYQIAAAEAGYDSNQLAVLQNYYNNNVLGSLGNPLLSFFYALTDQSLFMTREETTSNFGGDILGAAAIGLGAYLGE